VGFKFPIPPTSLGRETTHLCGRDGAMFEKIVLRRSDTGVALTLGEVAEALLFYQNVHLVLDPGSLQSLSETLGLQELLALIARKRLTAVYAEDMLASHAQTIGSIPRHSFNTIMLVGNPNQEARTSRRGRLELQLEKLTPSRSEARRFADQFMNLIPMHTYASNYFAPEGIVKSATSDMSDATYVTEAIRRVLQNQTGFEQFVGNLHVEVIHLDGGQFVLQSNINFEVGNVRRKAIHPGLEAITEGNILVALLDANSVVNIASHYGGDFYTSPINSEIAQIRFAGLLRRTGISVEHLQQFKDIVLTDYPSVREVINSKEKSFKEFELLLDQSDRWRRTVNQMDPDANLVTEYFKQASHESWVSSAPVKWLRFVIGLGMGAQNPIAGAAWSLADTFMMDKLKGWRPNHFVEEKLKPFLDKNR
jgi:hypothetical protein